MSDHGGSTDEALAALLNISEAQEEPARFEPGLLLTISGLVISGNLIASWRWAELMDEAIRPVDENGDPVPTDVAGLAAVFSDFGDEYKVRRAEQAVARETMATLSEDYAEALGRTRPLQWIHLSDARVLTGPDGLVPEGGVLWRGRLSAVDGWSLGRMQHSGQEIIELPVSAVHLD